jgi:hypothetical protein
VEVAHEALIRSWPQLRKWIDVDRAGLRKRTRLTEIARDWKSFGRDPAYFYSGARLAVAEEWDASHPGELSIDEADFLRRSGEAQKQREATELEAARKLAEEQKQRAELSEQREKEQKETARKLRRRAVVAVVAAGTALILLVTAAVMWRKSESAGAEAARQAQIATTERTAAQEQARIANDQRLAAQSARSAAEVEARRAQTEANSAQHALTDSFFRTIGVSDKDVAPRDEREALWELAQLDHANAAVRDNLVKRWFGTEEAFMRGQARNGQGFRAATELNPEIHRVAIYCAMDLGWRVAKGSNESLVDAAFWTGLVANLEPQLAAEIAKGIAAALEAPENPQATDSARLSSSLGSTLEALAAKMEPRPAAEIAKGIAAALEAPENPQRTDSAHLSNLASALATLAAKMEPQAAAEIAKGLAVAMENQQQMDYDYLSSIGGALAALATKMEP